MDQFVGVLGGMGTNATTYFYNKLMELDTAGNDQEHLKIMLYNNSKIPDRTNYILNQDDNPLNELINSAKILEATGVDFITMLCNTAHYFYSEIECNLDIPILNIVYEIALHLNRENIIGKRIGLLATKGTIVANVYKNIFKNHNLEIIYPSIVKQDIFNEFIYSIKMKKKLELEKFNDILNDFCNISDLDVIILGCTEFALVKEKINFGQCIVIDSCDLLVIRTYLYAKGIEDVKQVYKVK